MIKATRPANPTQPKGFTLLEVLIVLVIISIILTLISLNTKVFSSDSVVMDRMTQTFAYQFQWAQAKALTTQKIYKVVLDADGYHFERFDDQTLQWVVLDSPQSMRSVSLPSDLKMTLQSLDSKQALDQILIYPNQEYMPFVLTLLAAKGQGRVLTANQEGEIHWEPLNEQVAQP